MTVIVYMQLCVCVCVCVAGTVRRDWPIAGSRVVNDVRGRRPRGEFSNRQRNTDEVSVSCFMASVIDLSQRG